MIFFQAQRWVLYARLSPSPLKGGQPFVKFTIPWDQIFLSFAFFFGHMFCHIAASWSRQPQLENENGGNWKKGEQWAVQKKKAQKNEMKCCGLQHGLQFQKTFSVSCFSQIPLQSGVALAQNLSFVSLSAGKFQHGSTSSDFQVRSSLLIWYTQLRQAGIPKLTRSQER